MSLHRHRQHPQNPDLGPPTERPRFLSEAACQEIGATLARYAQGGGRTVATIVSSWTSNVRWARNQITTSGEVRDNHVLVSRELRGAQDGAWLHINDTSDAALVAAVRRAERLARLKPEAPGSDLITQYQPEAFPHPNLFVEATYELDADRRAEAAHTLMQSAKNAGMLSAGYLQVSAHSMAYISSWGYSRYFQYTWAQYSVTVRDPQGTGSGWAGVDWPDWSRIDGKQLSALALDKCLTSRNPVAIEPGRYTTILEPQAVCDFVAPIMRHMGIREDGTQDSDESNPAMPFNKVVGKTFLDSYSMLGERVMDERITIGADPMDPDLGFPPFKVTPQYVGGDESPARDVYHAATWITRGVVTALPYHRTYALKQLGMGIGLPQSRSLRMSVEGPTTSVAEMIATTKRGLVVTRFDDGQVLDEKSLLCRGYTRDGVWLIENGKISKAVKNLVFTESILFALNNVEQLGVPQRTFHPLLDPSSWWINPAPVIVPPLKIKDFSFTALCDAV